MGVATVLKVHTWGVRGLSIVVVCEVSLWGPSVVRAVVCKVSSGGPWVPRPVECLVVGVTGS